MLSLTVQRKQLAIWTKILAVALLTILATISFRDVHISAQDFPLVVGRIEGDDLDVVTTTPTGIETDAAPTVVASGSDVTVRSGHALLLLDSGGEISICGPAHFKMIKSSGAVTLALDYGRVHPSLESTEAFTIFTPTIVATPIAISGGHRDLTLGLEQNGEMCVLTARGAMRVEPQFSDQSVIVPQGGTVTLAEGQIQSLQADASACSCSFPRASLEHTKPAPAPTRTAPPPADLGALSRPIPSENKKSEVSQPPSAPAADLVYTVLMPPISYNANSPEPPPDPDPSTILLVREVRLRPEAVFRGHVNPAPAQATAATLPPPLIKPEPKPTDDRPAEPQPGLLERVRSFFHRLTHKSPCVGTGCSK